MPTMSLKSTHRAIRTITKIPTAAKHPQDTPKNTSPRSGWMGGVYVVCDGGKSCGEIGRGLPGGVGFSSGRQCGRGRANVLIARPMLPETELNRLQAVG